MREINFMFKLAVIFLIYLYYLKENSKKFKIIFQENSCPEIKKTGSTDAQVNIYDMVRRCAG